VIGEKELCKLLGMSRSHFGGCDNKVSWATTAKVRKSFTAPSK